MAENQSVNSIFRNRQDVGPPPMSYFRLSNQGNSGAMGGNDGLQEPLLEDDPIAQNIDNHPEPCLDRRKAREYIRRAGNYLAYVTLLTMLIVIPIVLYRALTENRVDFAAFDSAGVMVLGTIVLSLRLVYLHLTHWYMPDVQKYVVRILWMVPLYAVQSWLSLRYRDARIYIDAIRDLYEAYVIASFVYYLIELLGGQDALVRTLRSKASSHPNLGRHTFPLNLVLQEWELGIDFMLQCKHGVLQYVVCKTVATILTFFFEWAGIYGEGEFSWLSAYPYLAFMLNLSVMYALYCLVMLFHAVNDELRHPVDWRPFGKFLCVKGVVFFTWWQGVLIFYLKAKDIIKDVGDWNGNEVSNGLIDYCICVEMVFFAIAHSYSFSYKEYLPTRPELISQRQSIENLASSGGDDMGGRGDDIDGNGGDHSANSENGLTSQQAAVPALLDRPMNFKDAFWSSTVPKEITDDIHRFRKGVEQVKNQTLNPGAISLQTVVSRDSMANGALSDNNNNNNNSNDEDNGNGLNGNIMRVADV